jgi:hypothetical protein
MASLRKMRKMVLHLTLALGSVAVLLVTGLEAGVRALLGLPPGRLAGWLGTSAILVLIVSCAGGLGLWIGGASPREGLHFVYALLALAIVPVGRNLSDGWSARPRGLAVAVASLVALGVLVRLFQTG